MLDPEGGARVLAALDSLMEPDAGRPAAQRRVGRRSRLATAAQRRAVRLRDGGCVHPGCGAQVGWCDVHHIDAWSDAGGTDLDNLVVVCRRHHVACHEGRWKLQRQADGTIEAIPP
jgi:hypothetical protein